MSLQNNQSYSSGAASQQLELNKSQALAQIKMEGFYVEDSLPLSHLEGYYSGMKKFLPIQLISPITKKLLSEKIIHSEQIHACLKRVEQWQRYLPERADGNRIFICNLVNSLSGFTLELLLEECITSRRELHEAIKSCLEKWQFEQSNYGLVDIDSDKMTVQEQYRAARSNINSRRSTKKKNGFKPSGSSSAVPFQYGGGGGAAAGKTTTAGGSSKRKSTHIQVPLVNSMASSQDTSSNGFKSLSAQSVSDLLLLQWKLGKDSQEELMKLVKARFQPRQANSINCYMLGISSQHIWGNESMVKVRLSVEYRQSTTFEPSEESALLYHLSHCLDDEFVRSMLSTVKAKVARLRVHYVFNLTHPAAMVSMLKLQEPFIMADDVEELLNVTAVPRNDLIEKVRSLQSSDAEFQIMLRSSSLNSRGDSQLLNNRFGASQQNSQQQQQKSAGGIRSYSLAQFEELLSQHGEDPPLQAVEDNKEMKDLSQMNAAAAASQHLVTCSVCFVELRAKYFCFFQACGDVVCSSCYSKSPKMYCPSCTCKQLPTKIGAAIEPHVYHEALEQKDLHQHGMDNSSSSRRVKTASDRNGASSPAPSSPEGSHRGGGSSSKSSSIYESGSGRKRNSHQLLSGGNKYLPSDEELLSLLVPYRAVFKEHVATLLEGKEPELGETNQLYVQLLESQLSKQKSQYTALEQEATAYVQQMQQHYEQQLQQQQQQLLSQGSQSAAAGAAAAENTWSKAVEVSQPLTTPSIVPPSINVNNANSSHTEMDYQVEEGSYGSGVEGSGGTNEQLNRQFMKQAVISGSGNQQQQQQQPLSRSLSNTSQSKYHHIEAEEDPLEDIAEGGPSMRFVI